MAESIVEDCFGAWPGWTLTGFGSLQRVRERVGEIAGHGRTPRLPAQSRFLLELQARPEVRLKEVRVSATRPAHGCRDAAARLEPATGRRQRLGAHRRSDSPGGLRLPERHD